MIRGSGDMGLSNKSIEHIHDNRENPTLKKITLISINCEGI